MAMTSIGGSQDAFTPFWNPTRDLAHGTSRSSRDMHLDVTEVRLLRSYVFHELHEVERCTMATLV